MYLWRNLPKGQLSAVLRWVRNGCPAPDTATPARRPAHGLDIPAAVPSDAGGTPKT